MSAAAYYQEAFEIAMDAAGCWPLVIKMTDEQRREVGESIATSAENESLAIYRPCSGDRVIAIEREWQQRLEEERDRTGAVRQGAEKAVRRALGIHHDVPLSITDGGEVYRSDGRMSRII